MRVKLIVHTPEPDLVVYRAARTCYKAGSIIDEGIVPSNAELKRFINMLIKSGHTSTLEHVSFTFGIEGISRVVSHELVRHRIASYSQQSQRYVNYRDKNYSMVVPDSIRDIPQAYEVYRDAWIAANTAYISLIDLGIKPQDARYVLPNAMPTQIVVTMNARSLLNFFKLRCCKRAQPEMQELAFEMLKAVKAVAPIIFFTAGRQCAACTEEKKCNEDE